MAGAFDTGTGQPMEPATTWLLRADGTSFFLGSFQQQHLIAERTLGTVAYLLTHGAVLKDGDNLGVGEGERIRATYAAQGYKPGVPVMQLVVEHLDASVARGRGR